MQLLNSLFTISQETMVENTHSCQIALNPKHITYQGHFPGFPVTPGVVQLQIVEELVLRKSGEKACRLKVTNACKFLEIVDPTKVSSLRVDYTFDKKGKDLHVTASFSANASQYFKFKGVFELV